LLNRLFLRRFGIAGLTNVKPVAVTSTLVAPLDWCPDVVLHVRRVVKGTSVAKAHRQLAAMQQ
jgi:hypothetical protein